MSARMAAARPASPKFRPNRPAVRALEIIVSPWRVESARPLGRSCAASRCSSSTLLRLSGRPTIEVVANARRITMELPKADRYQIPPENRLSGDWVGKPGPARRFGFPPLGKFGLLLVDA